MNNKCISCGKALKEDGDLSSHVGANAHIFPIIYSGVVFRSSGQFGSTVIDQISRSGSKYARKEVQIIICDQCLVEKGEFVDMVIETKKEYVNREAEYKKFDEEYDEETRKRIIENLKKNGDYIPPHITKWKNR